MRIAAISKALALMLSIGGGMTLIVLKPVTAEAQAPPSLAQVVALDECDPATFNAALGPGFCLNVTPFGSAVPLPALLASVAAGTPNPNWDFEPDSLTIDSKTIHLTPNEFRLMSVLVKNAGKVLTHRQLLREVWGPESNEETHYLRVYMNQLRQKLESDSARPQYLLTESGVGYRLVSEI